MCIYIRILYNMLYQINTLMMHNNNFIKMYTTFHIASLL